MSQENGMHLPLETIQYVRNPISLNAKNSFQCCSVGILFPIYW